MNFIIFYICTVNKYIITIADTVFKEIKDRNDTLSDSHW